MRKIKRYILKKLGIVRLREQLDNEQIKIKELEKRNKHLMNVNSEMIHRINARRFIRIDDMRIKEIPLEKESGFHVR